MAARCWCLACALAVCIGCSGSLEQQLKTARSWQATVQLVAATWSRREVPASYASDTLRNARAALQRIAKAADASEDAGELRKWIGTIDALLASIARDDRKRAAQLADASAPERQAA